VRHVFDLFGGELVAAAVAHEVDEQQPHQREQDRQHHRLVDDVQQVQHDRHEGGGDAGDRIPFPAQGLAELHRVSSAVSAT